MHRSLQVVVCFGMRPPHPRQKNDSIEFCDDSRDGGIYDQGLRSCRNRRRAGRNLRSEYSGDFWQTRRAGGETSRGRRRRDQHRTIPSKTLRETAVALSGLRSRKLFGVDLSLRREATVADFMPTRRTLRRRSGGGAKTNCEPTKSKRFMVRRVLSILTRCGSRLIPCCARKNSHCDRFVACASGGISIRTSRVHDSDEILEIGCCQKPWRCRRGRDRRGVCQHFCCSRVEVHLIDGRDSLLGFSIARFLKTSSAE